MTAARKIAREWAPGELEASLVAAAVSGDETRTHLNKPWGQVMNGRGFVFGTDGHRLHAVACEAWQGFKRDNAPPGEQVIPWDAKWLGSVQVAALDDARAELSPVAFSSSSKPLREADRVAVVMPMRI